MEMVREALGSVLLLFGLAAALCAWVYGHRETLAIRNLRAGSFRRGPIVLSLSVPELRVLAAAAGQKPVRTKHGWFWVLGSGETLFAPHIRLPIPVLGLTNLFAFKGLIQPSQVSAQVVVRAPIGSSLAFISLVTALVGALIHFPGSCTINGVPFPSDSPRCLLIPTFFLGLVALLAALRLVGIRVRARWLIEELRTSPSLTSGAA